MFQWLTISICPCSKCITFFNVRGLSSQKYFFFALFMSSATMQQRCIFWAAMFLMDTCFRVSHIIISIMLQLGQGSAGACQKCSRGKKNCSWSWLSSKFIGACFQRGGLFRRIMAWGRKLCKHQLVVLRAFILGFSCEEKYYSRGWLVCDASAMIFPTLFLTVDEYRSVRRTADSQWFSLHLWNTMRCSLHLKCEVKQLN